ncbi:MATE family efflux transporter, partial [Psychrobacter sp.]|uniref:MATE family efflux transporter n=1 Tax=Psychrobacter sp. TaxID=56811 RepID=UPI003F9C4BE0
RVVSLPSLSLRFLQHSSIFTLLVTVVYATIMAALLVVYDDKIVGYFTNDDGVKEIATILMTYGAAFQFFSAMQMLISGVLRGFEDFVKPLLVILINYWLFIVPIVILSIKFNWIMRLCVEDIWLLMVVGLAVSSFVLAIVCRRKFKHIQLGS